MTDVLKLALERRAQIHEELEKLDEFIRYAESLTRTDESGAPGAPSAASKPKKDDGDSDDPDSPRPGVIRRGA